MTIFAPVLALYGRREQKAKEHKFARIQANASSTAEKSADKEEERPGLIPSYSQFVVSNKAKVIAGLLVVVLYFVSFIGIARMRATFEPYKTFPVS